MHWDIRELSQSNPKRTDSEGFINDQRKRYLSIEVNGLARHEGEYGNIAREEFNHAHQGSGGFGSL